MKIENIRNFRDTHTHTHTQIDFGWPIRHEKKKTKKTKVKREGRNTFLNPHTKNGGALVVFGNKMGKRWAQTGFLLF